jgi:predicted GNAT family acetyltransferase
MTATDVTIVDRPESSRYEAMVGGELAGFLDYRRGTERMLLRHTEVEPAFEGRGIGSALARRGLDDARAAGLSIIVTCPFITGWLEKHPDQADGVLIR